MSLRTNDFFIQQLNKIPWSSTQQLNKSQHLLINCLSILANHSINTIPGNFIDIISLIPELPCNLVDQSDNDIHMKFLLAQHLKLLLLHLKIW